MREISYNMLGSLGCVVTVPPPKNAVLSQVVSPVAFLSHFPAEAGAAAWVFFLLII
jgi:hypothetical protein